MLPPSLFLNVQPDYVNAHMMVPTGPETVRITYDWLFEPERLPLAENEKPAQKMVRFRSLGCYPLTAAIESQAATLDAVIAELRTSRRSERAGRLIDLDEASSMERKKREGYF